MASGEDNMLYVLILKDDLSGYVRLIPTSEADAETVAKHLLEWFANFGVVSQWVSDRGSHFRNELIKALREATKSSHHFTLAYCPWSNGTVEVVCRELLRTSRALLSELQLPQKMQAGLTHVSCLSEARAQQIMEIEKLLSSLEDMHRDVELQSNKKRKAAIDSHNRKTNVRSANFEEGDFVLRGVLERFRGSKPSLKWHGPFRV
eukprot:IDg14724t1